MAKKSTGLSNKMLGGVSGEGSLQDIFALGFVKLYAGSVPATADASIGSATLLGTYSVDGLGTGLTFDASVAGVLAKAAAETWKMTAGASGTATFFRLVPATNTTGLSATEARIQGTVGTGGSADMILGDTTITNGADYTLPVFEISFTPS